MLSKKLINRYFGLFTTGFGLVCFGLGATMYKLRTDLFENYSIDYISNILGGILLIYTFVHYGPKVSEIFKNLK
jgi:hypothetical protein